MSAKPRIRESSTNIFEDLGRADSGIHFLKAQLVAELYRLANARNLSQTGAGQIMGISQPEVSRLFKGHFREYSIERLIGFLNAFNQDVDITVRPAAPSQKSGTVNFTSEAAA
jgi:predicted XRE-type DNA-binding protein